MSKNDIQDYTILDVGCGQNEHEDRWGIDIVEFKGTNQIVDLNQYPWDIPSNHFEIVHAISIIEHVQNIPAFLNEIHRVSKNGAIVNIITPHFSSTDSYTDPTHLWHLGSNWPNIIINSYLNNSVALFKLQNTTMSFYRKEILDYITIFLIKTFGISWWEHRLSFIFRGQDIKTTLEVIK